MQTAAKKHFGQDRNLEAKYDADKGVVELFQAVTVVEEIVDPIQAVNQLTLDEARKKGMEVEPGDELVFQIFYRDEDAAEAKAQDDQYGDILQLKTFRHGFGRIAAQTAKQVILQRIREAERENVFNEYKDRKNEIVTGIVRRFERGNIIVDLGRAEAVLPVREQVPRETYRAGDRIQAYVLDVLREAKGPQIILSRASVNLLTKLFEMEVPEIAEGIVLIEAAAREPGGRAKIAVSCRDRDVDPVGACVGMKGSRVQAVVQELRGEKIDIVPWDEDPARFVCNALAPAEVARVIIDEANHAMELIVPDDQLSLAIGRRGRTCAWPPSSPAGSWTSTARPGCGRCGSSPAGHWERSPVSPRCWSRRSTPTASARPRTWPRPRPRCWRRSPGWTSARIPAMQEQAKKQMVDDEIELRRLEMEREQARAIEARRHPDELSQAERLMRVRGMSEKTVEQLNLAGYRTVEDAGHGEGHHQAGRRAGGGDQEGPPAEERGGELPVRGGEAARRARCRARRAGCPARPRCHRGGEGALSSGPVRTCIGCGTRRPKRAAGAALPVERGRAAVGSKAA